MQKAYLDGLSFFDRAVLLAFDRTQYTCEGMKQKMEILHPPELRQLYTKLYKLSLDHVVASMVSLHRAGYLHRSAENLNSAVYWLTEKGSDICRSK